MIKKVLSGSLGIVVIIALILLYNLVLNLVSGSLTVPDITEKWWAGYYQTSLLGKQWCVVRFVENPRGEIRMAFLSAFGTPDLFSVNRRSSDRSFVEYEMSGEEGMKIKAKQLYAGKRYMIQRLLAGRFKDFWKTNTEIAIRGQFSSSPPPNEIAIEPIEESRLLDFWRNFIRPEETAPDPKELLLSIGFLEK
jgi:hypothetical protein